MEIIFIFLVAVSLSMDAFSLALAYGTISLSKKEIKSLSSIVGIYHFFMPIIGMLVGNFIINLLHIKLNLITLIIFVFIGISMIISVIKGSEKVHKMKISEMILFGFAVSIDSFSIGIGIKSISNNFLLCSCIFSLVSTFFTYIGLILGNKLNILIGKFATILGGITLIILGLIFSI